MRGGFFFLRFSFLGRYTGSAEVRYHVFTTFYPDGIDRSPCNFFMSSFSFLRTHISSSFFYFILIISCCNDKSRVIGSTFVIVLSRL